MLVMAAAHRPSAAGPGAAPRLRERGLTLVETMTVLVVIAILAAIALPSLASILASQRLRAAGTDLVTSLLVARSEAIKRKAQVEVAPRSAGDWTSGWRVAAVATEEQIDRREPPGLRVAVTLAPESVVYERNGRLAGAGMTRFEFKDGESQPGVEARCVTIDPSGLPKLERGGCR